MQIVIEIPEEDYTNIKNAINSLIENGVELTSMSKVCLAIKDGAPLPKGHGRLIDEREVYKKFYCRCLAGVAKEVLDETSTIIEADTPKRRKGTPLEENDSGYNCENWIP